MAASEAVVDSSVVVKWFLPEPSRPEAMRLLRSYRDRKLRLIAPALLMSEVSNVFCKRLRRGELSVSAAREAYRLLKIHAPALIADAIVLDDAMRLALSSGQAVYDCLYLALAIHRRCDLITADRKFHAAMAPAFPMLLHL
jgi:predicted nucleic acid-binding protein